MTKTSKNMEISHKACHSTSTITNTLMVIIIYSHFIKNQIFTDTITARVLTGMHSMCVLLIHSMYHRMQITAALKDFSTPGFVTSY